MTFVDGPRQSFDVTIFQEEVRTNAPKNNLQSRTGRFKGGKILPKEGDVNTENESTAKEEATRSGQEEEDACFCCLCPTLFKKKGRSKVTKIKADTFEDS